MSRREWLENLSVATGRLVARLDADDAPSLRALRADIEDLHLHVRGELGRERRDHPRLLVFLCGTALMHAGAVGHTREERVDQAKLGIDPSVRDYATYIATEDTRERLQGWSEQGAEISYLSYHRDAAEVATSAKALETQGFPAGVVLSRGKGESYDDVVQRVVPDILIEDDCRSTGSHDIAYHQLGPKLRQRVTSVIVPQFGGLGELPADVRTLVGLSP